MVNSPIVLSTTGHFTKTAERLNRLRQMQIQHILDTYGSRGVAALSAATPRDTGLTAQSWYYTTGQRNGSYWIDFHNSNREPGGIPIIVLIHYGHATRNGGYVVGRDFINPTIAPIFDAIKNDVWREVTKR